MMAPSRTHPPKPLGPGLGPDEPKAGNGRPGKNSPDQTQPILAHDLYYFLIFPYTDSHMNSKTKRIVGIIVAVLVILSSLLLLLAPALG